MSDATDSLAGQFARGLAVLAGAAVGVGFSLLYARQGSRAPEKAPASDARIPGLAEILNRLDRIESNVNEIQAHLRPVESSVADLELRFQEYAKHVEAVQVQFGEARQKEMDAEVARLGALFVEVKHPILTSRLTQ